MTDITMRLDLLRGEMMKNDIDHYMIPSSDFHDSEYVGDYFKEREYMSGFNGSAGTLIVSIDSARLWTDGRYFLQAADQLEGSGIILMKQGEPGVPDIDEYLAQTMRFGETLGYDGRTVTVAYGEQLQKKLSPKGVHFRTDMDLVDKLASLSNVYFKKRVTHIARMPKEKSDNNVPPFRDSSGALVAPQRCRILRPSRDSIAQTVQF